MAYSRNEPIISVKDVGIRFYRNRRRKRSFRELVVKQHTGAPKDQFWPFRHVSFDIHAGEAIGVVGKNGERFDIFAGTDDGVVGLRDGMRRLGLGGHRVSALHAFRRPGQANPVLLRPVCCVSKFPSGIPLAWLICRW